MTDPFAIAWLVTLMCWITLEIVHHMERKDLYSRLMAHNLAEYEHTQTGPPKGKPNHLQESIKKAYKDHKNNKFFEDNDAPE